MDRATTNFRHRPRRRRNHFSARRKQFRFGSHFCRGETKPAEKDGETKSGRLTKLPVEQCGKTRTEQNDRKCVAITERAQTEPADANGERGTPQKKKQTEHRTVFQERARPFRFGKKKAGLSGNEFAASIRTDTEAETEKRQPIKHTKAPHEIVVDSREQTTSDGTLRSLGRFGKAA